MERQILDSKKTELFFAKRDLIKMGHLTCVSI